MSSKHASLIIVLILSFALMGCPANNGGNGNSGEGQGQLEGEGEGDNTTRLPSFIDETIVLEASDWVTGTETAEFETTFDLSSLNLVANLTFNDIEVSYTSMSTTDAFMYIHNFDTGEWDQVGFPIGAGGAAVTRMYNTIRDRLGSAQPYIDPDGILMLRGAPAEEVRVLRLRETYKAARLIGEGNFNSFDGLTYDGAQLWASSNALDHLFLIDGEGAIASEFASPGNYPFDMAFDGENIWLADGSDRILKLSLDGTLIDAFTVPTDYPGGLAWGDDSLWLAEYEGPDLRTFRIDPSASSIAGAAVITDEFQTPGGGSSGLAWSGENLLIASDALYVVNVDGSVVQSYALPVLQPRGLAWDGQAVVMFSQGPPGVGNSGQKLNWFRLR